jgi:NADPH:quinone reductase-like Zn-dependent oxidoreductase
LVYSIVKNVQMSDNVSPFIPQHTRELRSPVSSDGQVTLAIQEQELGQLGDDDVLVRVEAAPINPSDLGMLFAAGDVGSVAPAEVDGFRAVTAPVSDVALAAQSGRMDIPMPVGNEGAGTVVAAGQSDAAQALLGQVVGFLSGNAYAEFRVLNVTQCLAMADGTTAAQAAAAFVNPLTALGMVETMKAEGHTALVHTVGMSNLGQMLNRICLADGVELVNIVRKPQQVEALREQGAKFVCDSSADTFADDLTNALRETGATIAFDAIGGGDMACKLLFHMEQVASEGANFSRYGSDTLKQVYIYGGLDRGPTTLRRDFGMSWAIGGWLLTPFLMKLGQEGNARLRQRVADEITTTFASSYGMQLSLEDAVDPDQVRRYAKMATGDKALVTPQA